ncbi:hypothetical protein [Burkholderia sp. Se-20378]|uniref:hypothetical protein n=1 Tax=Burkholderia sp. Se-20378 TaxID=2703899 RepID=UPI0019801C4D|nr:hypothetical protein [Burkholderia sp. Se-20378]MBN3771193.1 hypothetical protein [Burkholderia sp. Se-20378]
MIQVQFFDSSETTIVSYFACPQDSKAYPNQAVIDTSDERWKAFCTLVDGAKCGLPTPAP